MSEPGEPQQPTESGEHPYVGEPLSKREPEEPMEHRWTPVVYGRTRRADRWWRAVPAGVDPDWLSATVTGVTAGGRDLEQRPRFLLAQNRSSRLVGVACRAAEISTTMNSDGSRPLYCFVGWCAPLGEAVGEGPALRELQARYVEWAAPVYEEWMRADWETHPSRLHQPHEPSPGPAPWPPVPDRAVQCPESDRPVPDEALFWPTDAADRPWNIAAHSRLPCVVSLGWRRARDAQALTMPRSDIVADDITELSKAPRPVAPPPQPSWPPPNTAAPAPDRDSHAGDPLPGDWSKGRTGMPSVPPALRPAPERDITHPPPTGAKVARLYLPAEPAYPGPPVEGTSQEHGSDASQAARKDKPPSWPPLLNPREWGRKVKRLGSSAGGKSRDRSRPERDEK